MHSEIHHLITLDNITFRKDIRVIQLWLLGLVCHNGSLGAEERNKNEKGGRVKCLQVTRWRLLDILLLTCNSVSHTMDCIEQTQHNVCGEFPVNILLKFKLFSTEKGAFF